MNRSYVVKIFGLLLVAVVIARAQGTAKDASTGATTHRHSAGATGRLGTPVEFQQGRGAGIPTSSLPVVVDGAYAPDSVPDWLAYYHFIMSVAVKPNAEISELARRESLLLPIGLGEADREHLIEALSGTRQDLELMAADRKQWAQSLATPSAVAAMKTLRVREKAILDNARSAIANTLSTEGQQLVDRHVKSQVKRHIKIRGAMPSQGQ